MKIGIVSDSHGMKKFIDRAIPKLSACDLIIHAGDNFSDSKYIHSMTKVGMMAVRGNCDFDNVESDLSFEVEGKKIFITHGDKYGVKYDLYQIEEKAKSINADIVVFGHTHVPLHIERNNIVYINPGSLSLPREVRDRTFVIMNLENDILDIEFVKLTQHL